MPHFVLDASALLAWLQSEAGSDVVEPALEGGVLAATNWSEVLQKAADRKRDPDLVADLLSGLGLSVEPVTEPDAREAARLWVLNPDLSLADRTCLAVAQRLRREVLTADRAWSNTSAAVSIELIR